MQLRRTALSPTSLTQPSIAACSCGTLPLFCSLQGTADTHVLQQKEVLAIENSLCYSFFNISHIIAVSSASASYAFHLISFPTGMVHVALIFREHWTTSMPSSIPMASSHVRYINGMAGINSIAMIPLQLVCVTQSNITTTILTNCYSKQDLMYFPGRNGSISRTSVTLTELKMSFSLFLHTIAGLFEIITVSFLSPRTH